MTDKEKAFAWIKANVGEKEFEDSCMEDETTEDVIDFYAYEIDKFHKELAPKTPLNTWVNRNYKVETFFQDHERQASRYYN